MARKENDKSLSWRERYEAHERYDADNCVRKHFKFNKNTDADILKAFEEAPSIQGLVKDAIRFYLAHREDFND